ncbi:hypothetical protein HYT56_00790 [Candidatus Woesearchaeota archaeon]|nr:hypothetical protein [Candidatus Woesearchaeota archaeon]
MSDEEGTGIGNIVSIILIIVVALALLLLLPGTVWPKTKEAFTNIVGEKGELKDKFDKVFNEKEINLEKEKEDVEEISAFFTKVFDVRDNNCISKIDLSSISDKNFDLEINGNRKSLINRKSLREYPLNVANKIFFLKNMIKDSSLILTDGFSRINNEPFSDLLYKNGNEISLMDEFSAAYFSAKYSPVFAKKNCGKVEAEIKKLKLVSTEGIIDEIGASFDKEVSDIILHFWYVYSTGSSNGINDEREKLIDLYFDNLKNKITAYYDSLFAINGCWRYEIHLTPITENYDILHFQSNKVFGDLIYEERNVENYKTKLVEDEPRDPREIGEIKLTFSTLDECRKV